MKKLTIAILVLFVLTAGLFAQEAENARPWEETIRRIENGKTPNTNNTYSVEIIYYPYSHEAYVIYVIFDALYQEEEAVSVVSDVAKRLRAEFGYDKYGYSSDATVRFDNEKHLARYRINIVFLQNDNN